MGKEPKTDISEKNKFKWHIISGNLNWNKNVIFNPDRQRLKILRISNVV